MARLWPTDCLGDERLLATILGPPSAFTWAAREAPLQIASRPLEPATSTTSGCFGGLCLSAPVFHETTMNASPGLRTQYLSGTSVQMPLVNRL